MSAEAVLAALRTRGLTLATAESLTGGLVGAALTAVGGSSDVYRGGVVCYATDLKATLAGVPADVLDAHGPVAPETAAALARGVARACGADVGLATTGVAGPSPQDGHPVGEVYVAAALSGQEPEVRRLHLTGDREAVRAASVEAVLDLLLALADVLLEARPEG
ncbi:competence/damage-inducible protein cinA [Microlunatus sagamiharensis]|uniref:Competence/damage-inducible protein cinA n=1 Tax=Microlunatus sagamiharensis TaxID=546874 RepID=A0A1H2LYC1_9ACTN|nr:nicotinamide-nucleotide amidohydrolase family protein [Microlunatus sagamiharensis]SDU85862.1 competence/damage-inducible protein cinA [Microlunatus sagamiharensis]